MLALSYTMLPLSSFFDHVLPEIPGYVRSLVEQAIRDSAIDFCERTRAWQETLTDTVLSGTADYQIDYPGDARFHEVREVLIDGLPLTNRFTPEELTKIAPSWRTETGTLTSYTTVDEAGILLYRIPDADHTLEVDAVMVPAIDCSKLPDFLLNRHHTAIAKGAKTRLMVMGKKPWTDRELAMRYGADVEQEIGTFAFRKAMGQTRNPARVRVIHGIKD